MERVELGLHLMLVHHRVEELHLVDCVQHLVVSGAGEESLDSGHGELGVRLLRLHDNSHATIVEQADGLHHAEGLVQGAIVVMLGKEFWCRNSSLMICAVYYSIQKTRH